MSELAGILTELKKAAEGIKKNIHTLDEQINALEQERQALMDAPVSREDYAKYIKEDLERRGELFLNRMRFFSNGKGRGSAKMNLSFIHLERTHQEGRLQLIPFMNGEDFFDGFNPSPEAFYWYFGDLIAERFMAALDKVHTWQEGGMPIAARRKRIAEIDREVDGLVSQRDELAGQLMNAGVQV